MPFQQFCSRVEHCLWLGLDLVSVRLAPFFRFCCSLKLFFNFLKKISFRLFFKVSEQNRVFLSFIDSLPPQLTSRSTEFHTLLLIFTKINWFFKKALFSRFSIFPFLIFPFLEERESPVTSHLTFYLKLWSEQKLKIQSLTTEKPKFLPKREKQLRQTNLERESGNGRKIKIERFFSVIFSDFLNPCCNPG